MSFRCRNTNRKQHSAAKVTFIIIQLVFFVSIHLTITGNVVFPRGLCYPFYKIIMATLFANMEHVLTRGS